MKKLVWLSLCAAACVASGEVKFASIFGDKMVLQRGTAVRVWGTADAGESVTVTFGGASATAVANEKGKWRTELPPMPASKESRTLKAQGKSNAVECRDVLVGEVWFVCGQSNTELPLWGGNPHFRDAYGALTAQMTRKPAVRFAYTSNYRWSAEPKESFDRKVEWKEFNKENLMGGSSFSAMGVYYALELYGALDIPVAVIGSYWGGTRVEPWTPKCGFEAVPACKAEATAKIYTPEETKASEKAPYHKNAHQQPTVLWNEQVAPWCPYAIKGFIWYQGCSNAGDPNHYADLMHALYRGWAKQFENPNLKLYFVQLAPWGFDKIALIQEAQAKFDAEEPNAGMAVINDYGNLADIHPNQKYIVGKRLALHALKRDYGFNDIVDNSPTLKSWKVEGNQFKLTFHDAKGWFVYNPDWNPQTGFEIAGADGKFVPAQLENLQVKKQQGYRSNGVMNGSELIVSAEGVAEPKKLRYLYSRPWYGCLYNEVGLPLGAFHIDADAAK
ncbi:MAG: hypothetical protein IJR99_14645 [Kiritimatiellae bacterium]|nr:hypothetical protein [Kiritimatiellia bacterium]